MKPVILIQLIICSSIWVTQPSPGQSAIRGKVLSADGNTIPKTVISIHQENPRDIFSSYYDDIYPDTDGAYQLLIREPGMYRITFRGVFHQTLVIPVLIYDQPFMDINVLLLPRYYNEGTYFENEEYMKWIRVYGNFNNYNFNEGRSFSLNNDGSISAFVPVTSDTIRYLVRGLTYGHGSTPLPADEYDFNEERNFESVLYKELPEDSLEIQYKPGQSIPYKRHLPAGVNPQRIILRGFISFEEPQDQYWIVPLSLMRLQYSSVHIVDREFSSGVPADLQKEIQKKYQGGWVEIDLAEIERQIRADLNNANLQPQQQVLLMLAYAGVLSQAQLRTFYWQRIGRKEPPDITFDKEIIMSIPDQVPPVHPAWSQNRDVAEALLKAGKPYQKFTGYFHELVKYHPDDRAVRFAALALIRFQALDYESVEKIPVYQSIVDRYGEGDLARDAHRVFQAHRFENQNRGHRE